MSQAIVNRPQFSEAEGWWARTGDFAQIVYWGVHVACLAAFVTGVSLADLALLGATLWLRMFAITAGYHRYFAHKTYKTGRVFQFLLAFSGASATQKGPLWWAGTHRLHHGRTDQEGDPHSPRQGFYHAHQGWIFSGEWDATPLEGISDFAKYPELVWLNRWHVVPPIALAVLCFIIGGWSGLVWGFFVSTTLLWHLTYSVNSITHIFGRRRYDTPDTSRNNWLVALLTLGEGWHNNHHRFMASARNGFFWWEIDVTWYGLLALEKLGLIHSLRPVPEELRNGQDRSLLKKAA